MIRGSHLGGDLDFLTRLVGELIGAEPDELVPSPQVLAGSPAQHLPPELVVIDVADTIAQSPGAVEVEGNDPAEGIPLDGDEGVGRLQFPRRRSKSAAANRVGIAYL